MDLDTSQLLALAAALGWASGLRLYAVVFLTGLAGSTGWVELPEGLKPLGHSLVLGASGTMLVVEFLADKIPGVDSLWDVLHTLIRIPAGAALAASVFGTDEATWSLVAALLGGSLAATSHLSKATTRAAINTSPEPFSNVGASLLEDTLAPAALWLAIGSPTLFLALLVPAVLGMLWLMWVLAGYLRGLLARLRGLRRSGAPPR
ncbi:DUF4126 domain-containing protein [Caldimonas tepidiphila]|uniref:DUF4126 domain-containing protein n=1 Tax=Caldimonas tepidiphila TaxID=2315841 RepID=UPI000E5B6E9B|nr:DUF4126 domain-containing protein [Caldimonas tepidiphila]